MPDIDFFNKYLKPYINVLKVETVPNVGQLAVYFTDGSLATFDVNSTAFYPNAKDFMMHEVDGKTKRILEDAGKKWFTFSAIPGNNNELFSAYEHLWDGTTEMLLNDSALGCKENVTKERAYCTKLIQRNGWKIPKDYPIKL